MPALTSSTDRSKDDPELAFAIRACQGAIRKADLQPGWNIKPGRGTHVIGAKVVVDAD